MLPAASQWCIDYDTDLICYAFLGKSPLERRKDIMIWMCKDSNVLPAVLWMCLKDFLCEKEQKLDLTLICIIPQKIYLQMTSNTCLKTTKQRSIESEKSCYWLHWSCIIHVIFESFLLSENRSSCKTIDRGLSYFKFPVVSYSHIYINEINTEVFVLWIWKFWNVCSNCSSLRGIRIFTLYHFLLLLLKGFIFFFLPQTKEKIC